MDYGVSDSGIPSPKLTKHTSACSVVSLAVGQVVPRDMWCSLKCLLSSHPFRMFSPSSHILWGWLQPSEVSEDVT